jgi:hypothetical protein
MRDGRQHLVGHLFDDLIGIAIRHQAGQRAATGHPIPPGIVDDDQVNAAGLFALGRDAGPRPATDDDAAAGDLLTKPSQDFTACLSGHVGLQE